METNLPIRQLFHKRLIPIFRNGNHIQLLDKFQQTHDFSMNWDNNEFLHSINNGDTNFILSGRMALETMANIINANAYPGSFLKVNGKNYIPVCQIEAYFPKLECTGKLYKSWQQGCECTY